MCLRFEVRTTLIMKCGYHGGRAKSRDVRVLLAPQRRGDLMRPDRPVRRRRQTDLPDGQISKNLSSPLDKNISVFLRGKSPAYLPLSRARKRGVGHRHERWARDAMDAKLLLTNSSDADGKVVWS